VPLLTFSINVLRKRLCAGAKIWLQVSFPQIAAFTYTSLYKIHSYAKCFSTHRILSDFEEQ